MEVHWDAYMIDGRFKKYEEGTIKHLVTKHENQRNNERVLQEDGLLNRSLATLLLKESNSAIITLWDSASNEISEELIHSCDVHSFIDDEMVLSYG